MNHKNSSITESFGFWLIRLSIGLLLFILVLFLWNERESLTTDSTINVEKFNSFGAMVSGIVGTTLSLAGIVFIYAALVEQRKDMEINKAALGLQTDALTNQIKEFKLQTQELKATRKVYLEQTKTLSLQRFETTFFQMLTLHHGIVDSMYMRNHQRKGRDCFETFNNLLRKEITSKGTRTPIDVINCYEEVFKDNQTSLGHYFRNLYHIVKLINNSSIEDKKVYYGLLRAQLSHYELILLFYNCLSGYGKAKFKPLIEQSSLFKNLNWKEVRGGKDIIRLYYPSAYGEQDYRFLSGAEDW